MLRLTVLLCSGLFLVMLLGGRDFGQLRPGLARAEAVAAALPVTAAAPAVETVALASDTGEARPVLVDVMPAVPRPGVVAAPAARPAPVVVADVTPPVAAALPDVVASAPAVAPEPIAPPSENTVFTLATYADAPPVADTQAVADAATVPEASANGEIWYVAGNALNVRAGPSTDNAVVGKLSRGEAMLVVAREGDEWAHIKIEGDGIEGYVATRFLSATAPVVN